jgi:hypothetical protein
VPAEDGATEEVADPKDTAVDDVSEPGDMAIEDGANPNDTAPSDAGSQDASVADAQEEDMAAVDGGTPNNVCEADDECVATKYEILVTSVNDCFCPMCPEFPATAAEAAARKAAWTEICTAWEAESPCPSPKCANPGTPSCEEGQCVLTQEEEGCDGLLICDSEPIDCKLPFISVVKDGCWACGYPETCTCSISEWPTCKMATPNCPPGTELAVQGEGNWSCWACVDPLTCEEEKPSVDECKEKGECTFTDMDPTKKIESVDDCYCPTCPNWAVTLEEATTLDANWDATCKDWAEAQPCIPPPCPPPIGNAECVGGQCVMPSNNGEPPGG